MSSDRRVVVFLGPSLEVARAKLLVPEAEFRPPVRRGDMESIDAAIVAIVDGVFDQSQAVSPTEIRHAIARGVTVLGSSSMGALRASEVHEVIGVGRVYEMYRERIIERDDEVALLFDAESQRALTEPLVNIRYAAERLARSGTIDETVRARIVAAATELHYRERTYTNVLRRAGLLHHTDHARLIELLRSHDLKREDAQLLLERVMQLAVGSEPPRRQRLPHQEVLATADDIPQLAERADHPLMIWEFGDVIAFDELCTFLKVTGRFWALARSAFERFVLEGNELDDLPRARPGSARRWIRSRIAPESTRTLEDLGIARDRVVATCAAERRIEDQLTALIQEAAPELALAIRAELWMDDLALKRELLRTGSVRRLAVQGRRLGGPPTASERQGARSAVCALLGVAPWRAAVHIITQQAVTRRQLATFIDQLALARRAAAGLARRRDLSRGGHGSRVRRSRPADGIVLQASPRAPNSLRFCLPVAEAAQIAERLIEPIGITRVGMVGELDTIGVHVSHAFRSSNWSSTLGSGKGVTRDAARVGGIMEELEKYCQDMYVPQGETVASYEQLGERAHDPRAFDLPYDSAFEVTQAIGWVRCYDLAGERWSLLPTAMVTQERVAHDVLYSARRGAKVFSTSGLASGFTLEEALLHAICELVERHAQKLAELQISNPGGVNADVYSFVDLDTTPPAVRKIIAGYANGGVQTRVLDITSDVAIPTFEARVFGDLLHHEGTSFSGFAAHPQPEVAITMALLEAAQTRIGNIAGAREDLAVQVRSLGRHERPVPVVDRMLRLWYGVDPPLVAFDAVAGFAARDVRDDIQWVMSQLRAAGYSNLFVIDYSRPEVAPARAVRVLIPQLETNSPFYTGARARMSALRDLLPDPRCHDVGPRSRVRRRARQRPNQPR